MQTIPLNFFGENPHKEKTEIPNSKIQKIEKTFFQNNTRLLAFKLEKAYLLCYPP